MAEVDFSHARITPSGNINPSGSSYLGMTSSMLFSDSSLSTLISSGSRSQLVNTQKQFVYQYQGTFTANGTEFYVGNIVNNVSHVWKVSNISFQSGDTYVFKIRADLICQ